MISVLLVEDAEDDYFLIKEAINDGFGEEVEIVWSATLEEALETIANRRFDVILQDLYLPPHGPEGLSRTFRIAGNTPIIAVSGATSPDLFRQAIDNGAISFLAKDHLNADNVKSIITREIQKFQSRIRPTD